MKINDLIVVRRDDRRALDPGGPGPGHEPGRRPGRCGVSDIVAKLKDGTRTVRWSDDRVRLEAAAEIERLRVRVAELEAERGRWKAEALAWRKRAKYDGSKGEFNAIKMSDAEALVAWLRATNNLPKG